MRAAALDGGDGHARYAAWLRARGDRRGDALALALEHKSGISWTSAATNVPSLETAARVPYSTSWKSGLPNTAASRRCSIVTRPPSSPSAVTLGVVVGAGRFTGVRSDRDGEASQPPSIATASNVARACIIFVLVRISSSPERPLPRFHSRASREAGRDANFAAGVGLRRGARPSSVDHAGAARGAARAAGPWRAG